MRRLDSGGLSASATFSGGELEPKQLSYSTLAPVSTSTAQTTNLCSTVAGGRVGLVVRALAFHQCGPGSISAPGVMWIEFVGSLLCYERFSPGYSGFPLSSKTSI